MRVSRSSRKRSKALRVGVLAFGPALCFALVACEGDGGNGGLVVESRSIAKNCTPPPTLSDFPSGLAILSERLSLATMVQLDPNGFVVYDLQAERPRIVAVAPIGLDSDGDGLDDAETIAPILGFPVYPLMGGIQALGDDIALTSTSNYEQVLVVDPKNGQPISVTIDVPGTIPAERFPLLPAPGSSAIRTGISTLACVFPSDPIDSGGVAIGVETSCDPSRPAFLTNLTAGTAVADRRLFVAMSSLVRSGRFFPGTIIVFEWDETGGALTVRPSASTPFLSTTGFNPTGMARVTTPGGRELVLVTVTGAIGSASGAGNVLTPASVDVVDPTVPRIAATIPLGFAGPSFDAPAIDPTGQIAWLGASSQRHVYAIDLRPLDDAALYAGAGPPVVLDGLTLGYDDARIFTASRPFVLPRRTDGRASGTCEGFTDVTVNSAGTEVFASDFCDGTITRIALDLAGSPPAPFPVDRFQVVRQDNAFSPNDVVGELRAPNLIAARPGVPGVDYTSPDVLTLVGQPDGQICSLRIESN